MLVSQCREPIASIALGILLIADADARLFEQRNDSAQQLFARQAGEGAVTRSLAPDRRQFPSESC
jgi:hypothetical protein